MNKLQARIVKQKTYLILKYLIPFLLLIIFSNSNIGFEYSPFSSAFLFALVWCNFNLYIISVEYFFANIFFNMTIDALILISMTIGVLILFYLLHKIIKIPMNIYLVSLYYIISQFALLYFQVVEKTPTRNILIYLFFGILFLYMSVNVLQVILYRNKYLVFTLDEYLSIFAIVTVFAIGVSNFHIQSFDISKLVCLIFSCLLVGTDKRTWALMFSLAFGLGVAITLQDLNYLAMFALITSSLLIFRKDERIKSSLVLILVDLGLYYLFFNNIDVLNYILPTIIVSCVYVLIPKSWLTNLESRMYVMKNEKGLESVLNVARKNIYMRLLNLSTAFNDMERIYRSMIKKQLTKEQVVKMLSSDLCKECCKDCIDKNKCHKTYIETELTTINKMVEKALQKGKISILDLPASLTARCNKVNTILSAINTKVLQFKDFEGMQSEVNNVKILLSDQIGSVGNLMLNLGKEIDNNIRVDYTIESKIIEKLLSFNIICTEVLLYKTCEVNERIVLIIKGDNAYNQQIEKVVSSILKKRFEVVKVSPSDTEDFYSVTLSLASKFNIVFGIAKETKLGSTASGDAYSVIKLNNSKFLLALCDGMGSGVEAQIMSANTLSLIESFYKAGFDNDSIIESVNKLLSVNINECYSALDLAIVNLDDETIDIIKLGAPFSIIKRKSSVDKIEGSAVPIGIVDKIKVNTIRVSMSSQDILIMATDGVTDAFDGIDEMIAYVNSIASINPQIIAETIIEYLKEKNMQAKDDLTVLVARIYYRG